jgi:hypothetical protein
MTERNLIHGDPHAQGALCLACERLDRERTTDARALLAIAKRCGCGGVTRAVLHELTLHALEDVQQATLARMARAKWARLTLAPWV